MIHVEDLVILYDNKFLELLGEFHMHWLGPYMIRCVKKVGIVQLKKLNRRPTKDSSMGFGSKFYRSGCPIAQ